MQDSPRTPSRANIIPLNTRVLDGSDRQQIEKTIRKIVRNVRFEFLEQEYAIRLLGPDMYYHALDPHLPAELKRFEIAFDDILSYRSQGDLFDLCLEDTWSGYLIADDLRRSREKADLVLIHLDDHTDMMSTLLEFSNRDGLLDPATGRLFNPTIPADWEAAIHSGSVSIGCFVTPFFFTNFRTHVRHLNNAAGAPTRHCSVNRKPCSYELIPGKRFAAIELNEKDEAANAGSYVSSPECEAVLDALPSGRVVVHVDLDYFINDFNGNPREGSYVPDSVLIKKGRQKLDCFFKALHSRRVKVDHWIVATSPGFCSACHWAELLNALTEKIDSYRNTH